MGLVMGDMSASLFPEAFTHASESYQSLRFEPLPQDEWANLLRSTSFLSAPLYANSAVREVRPRIR